jgi:energy-converting hydrogenase Eha subunit E
MFKKFIKFTLESFGIALLLTILISYFVGGLALIFFAGTYNPFLAILTFIIWLTFIIMFVRWLDDNEVEKNKEKC